MPEMNIFSNFFTRIIISNSLAASLKVIIPTSLLFTVSCELRAFSMLQRKIVRRIHKYTLIVLLQVSKSRSIFNVLAKLLQLCTTQAFASNAACMYT